MSAGEFVQQIGRLLATSLNPATQKQSEEELRRLDSAPGFIQALLLIVEGAGLAENSERHVRQAAAVLFKNFIKLNWPNEPSPALTPEVRQGLKASMVEKMVAVKDASIQIQLVEAIVQIASIDFPQAWPELMELLVGRLSEADHVQNNAVLRTIHYVVKRYRSEGRTDELFSEINFVMARFAPALLQLYASLQNSLQASSGNPTILEMVVTSMTLCNKIFYSLSSQDLPAYFEEHMREFMDIFKAHFTLECPSIEASVAEEEEGPLEKLRVSVAEIINLYAGKYEEDFPMLPAFVELSWTVLTTRVQSTTRFDRLASASMAFLATVAKQAQHRELFGPVLQLLCDKIILPNMVFRESDLERFEDEPVEFIRREEELMSAGVEEVSRRAAAVLLTRGLMEFYESEVTSILAAYIQQYLQQYAAAPAAAWREKNVATQLFAAIAIKGSVQAYGVTRLNGMVQLEDFFQQNILPDLQPANEALHPILKMDAIRFVHQFRGQLGRENLVVALPLLMHHVASHNHVIHTYAAMAIERILAIRGAFAPADLHAILQPLCRTLLHLILAKKGSAKLGDNEMLMKALMRVMLLESGGLTAMAPELVDGLSELAWEVARNPANPRFNHFLFEALMTLIRYCARDPAVMALLESKLLSVFQEIVQADLSDFLPYMIQLYAGMVQFTAAPALPPYASELLQAALQPSLWASPGNVPALVRFLQACLLKGSLGQAELTAMLPSLLGIFQTLLGSRVNDLHAFSLLHALLQSVPVAVITPYLQPALTLLLRRLQSQKSSRVSLALLLALAQMTLSLDSASAVFNLLEGIQPKMVCALMRQSLLPEASRVREPSERRALLLSLVRWIVACPELAGRIQERTEYSALWLSLLSTVLSLLANIPSDAAQAGDDPSALYEASGKEEEVLHGGSAYARLQVLPPVPRFPPTSVDPVQILVHGLAQMAREMPALRSAIDTELDANLRNVLHIYLQQSNVSL